MIYLAIYLIILIFALSMFTRSAISAQSYSDKQLWEKCVSGALHDAHANNMRQLLKGKK